MLLRYMLSVMCVLLLGCNPVSLMENDKNETQVVATEANLKLTVELLKQGYIKEAKQKLLLAKRMGSRNPAVWFVSGYFCEKIGETIEAEKDYKYAIALKPNMGAAHNNYGAFLCRQKRYQESLQEFMLAVKDPEYLDTAAAYENAGLCALKTANLKTAAQYFRKALNHDPGLRTSAFYLAKISNS